MSNFPTLRVTAILSFLFLLSASAAGELRITEFVADNAGAHLDSDGAASDWIELHNSGSAPVSTDGFSLTDNAANLTKWELPDVTIPAGGYLVVFASGKDRRDPGQELHTSFSLSAGGEYLALVGPDGSTLLSEFGPAYPKQFFGVSFGTGSNVATETETVIPWPTAATWFAPTSDIGDSWQAVGFDDSGWNASQTGIGYGYTYPGFLGAGGNTDSAMRGLAGSCYLRVPFTVDDPAEMVTMTLELFYEDGFAAYLNGHLVASSNLPNTLAFDSISTARREIGQNDAMDQFPIDFAGRLLTGDNVLAFQVLNDKIASSDLLLIPRLSVETRDLSGGMVGGYLAEPTPGAPNAEIEFADYVRDTTFDIDRGFFDAPFDVTIDCATPGATIVYTTDGSTPTMVNGTQVPAADETTPPTAIANITTTTPLRAAAFKTGSRPSNIDTQTYLFLDDVLDQPVRPAGYPLPWRQRDGDTIGGDYEMDQNVVGPIYGRDELKNALQDVPTISIVTDIANLFDQQTGIQMNPQDSGPASERRVSVEMMNFEDGAPIQLDAGMRMNGNASRNPSRPKHNFRLAFRNEYGAGRLNFPLFGNDAPTERFNQIILRGGNGNSWIHPSNSVYTYAMYIRDQWYRDSLFAMGYPEALQREVHVYFNGLYWGMHHLFERIEEEWASERFGGEDDDWEGFRIVGGNNIEIIKGTPAEESARMLESWRAVLDAALAGDLAGAEQYLDLDHFIDYMLLNFHGGNTDWDQNNVRAMRRINPPGKFQFFCHDAERAGFNALSAPNININVVTKNTVRGPTSVNTALRTNPEYAMRFADRAYRHMFNGGALTPENGAALWAARADGIREAMKAESARWGDFRGEPPRTLVQWETALNREYDQWFPFRTPVTIGQLRATGLYPDIDPPVFNQHGGSIAEGSGVILTNDSGNIYYTTDGSDPRLAGGGVNPNAIMIDGSIRELTLLAARATGWSYLDDGSDQGSTWKEPAYNDSTWASGDAPLGFGRINGHPFGGPQINPEKHVTIYFRKEIGVADVNLITKATARVMSDGGAIVYLNGVGIARHNMPEGPVDYQTLSLDERNVPEGTVDVFDFPPSAFVEGTNVIAVEVHDSSTTSSDMGMDLQIDVTALNTSSDAIQIDAATTVRARSLDGSEWSALNQATFITAVPASAGNLVISEIFYHPADESEATEYLELMNISGEEMSLAGVVFNGGITFAFPDDATLGAGERLLLVADLAGFQAVFGNGLPVAGVYIGRLDNGGEGLLLTAADGSPIVEMRYDDRAPWPQAADGGGYSLTLAATGSNPDLNDAANWRSSVNPGGSPGESDSVPFTGSTSDDLLEYALADPLAGLSVSFQNLENNGAFDDYLVVTVAAKLAADDARFVIEFSGDLESWERGTAVYLGAENQPESVALRHWRAPGPVTSSNPVRYARLVLVSLP